MPIYVLSRRIQPVAAGDAFTVIQTDLGGNVVADGADSVLTLTSPDSSILITGLPGSDTVELELATDFITNAHINSAAAIDYSKLALTGDIVNADINATAAIALSKLAALTTSRAVQTNSSTGFLEVSSVTNTELALLSGKTSLGTIIGATGSTDNAIIRADGTGGVTIQSTGVTIDDNNHFALPNATRIAWGPNPSGIRISSDTFQVWLNNGGFGSQFDLVSGQATFFPLGGGTFQLGGNNFGVQQIIQAANGTSSTKGSDLFIRAGNMTNTTIAQTGGDFSIVGGSNASNNAAARAGDVTITGGAQTHASGSARAGNVIIQGGAATNATSADGVVQIGRTGTTDKNILNNMTESAGSVSLTITNGPATTSGDPAIWLRMTINGTDYVSPWWTV